MLARIFIDRPIFAWVISIVIVFAGLAAVWVLPIAQYPEITPPTINVSCMYPGASAQVVADTVAAPIEQQVNGVENMLYMFSQSTNDGGYSLSVTFKLGTDLNMAQVLVQNRVSQAMPLLPDTVKANGVTTKKKSPSILLVVNLHSEINPETKKPYFEQLYLSNYATIQVRDELARIDGVGDVSLMGQQDYSMRVWLDPNKLAARDITANDVVNSLKEQNVQVAAGQIGQPPIGKGQVFQYTMTTLGRLIEAEQFGDIIIKSGEKSAVTRLKDIGRIELGAKNQDTQCFLDGRPSVGLATYQLPGSNALATAELIREKMHELEKRFPEGLKYSIVYDTTPFIEESVHEVFKTLYEAVILVALVVLLFLQDWKAVALPLIDVGVSLVGTFAVLLAMGFTMNNLTLFGLVLAIGIVVDDAIMVLENIERWIGMGYKPREATIHAMDEITGPVIAVTLVLSSVFLPSAFLGGITGQFYRQFALTISASMIISAINAMTMTPARATAIFQADDHEGGGQHKREALPWWGIAALFAYGGYWLWTSVLGFAVPALVWPEFGSVPLAELRPQVFAFVRGLVLYALLLAPGLVLGTLLAGVVNGILAIIFGIFNKFFDLCTHLYGYGVTWALRLSFIVLVLYVGLIGLTGFGFTRIPGGFIPNQDKGYLLVNVQLPDSSSLERTQAVTMQIDEMARKIPGVAHTISIPGQSFVLNAVSSNFGSLFVILKPFDERHSHEESADHVADALRKLTYVKVIEARVAVFGAPPVDGLGNAGGFKLMVEDRGDTGSASLQAQADELAKQGNAAGPLVGLFNSFSANTPQLFVDVDRTKCKTLDVPLTEVFDTLQGLLGSRYVNDFNRFGRTWQVNIQADADFRATPEKLKLFRVRNSQGKMIPLGTLVQVRDSSGPVMVTRYNTYPAATINGAPLPGVSSGTAIEIMDALSQAQLPRSMTSEWTELTYMQILAGNTAIFAFLGAVVLVFLVLAAQYESWSLPLAVILVVPMCLLCALIGVFMARMDLNIFVQVGFIVLVGLATKNAILVVEFAKELVTKGQKPFEATVEAAKVRLRPIIMTSFAFILGVMPLMFSHGAVAEMRHTLGVAVFSGMLGVTLFGLLLTPVFFFVIMRRAQPGPGPGAGPGPADHGHEPGPLPPPQSAPVVRVVRSESVASSEPVVNAPEQDLPASEEFPPERDPQRDDPSAGPPPTLGPSGH